MAGKTFQDRELAARVRTLALNQIESVLNEGGMGEFKKAILLKISGTVLPRLNEVSGIDGEPIELTVVQYENNNTIPISTKKLSVSVSSSKAEIQDSSVAQKSWEEQDSVK